MKGYENYKSSKFLWFDKLPENWIEGKIKYLFEISRGRVISQLELKPEAKFPVYSSQTKNDGCLGHIDTFDYEGEMLTWTTDGANAGSVFQRKGQFNCTNVCGILIPKKELGLRYYFYYVDFIAQFYKRPDTNGAKIMSNEMAEIHCFIPSLQEQTAIASFLDYKTNLIDATIEKKKRLIELLKEKRQSVINELITKGLNTNTPMKDSGVEWLGEIPEHWKIIKLKHIVEMRSGNFISAEIIEQEGAYPVYGGNGLRGFTSEYTHEGYFPLIGRQGALCGNINYASGKFWATEHAVVVSSIKEINSYWIGELLRLMNLNQYSQASAQPGLSVEKILNLRIPFPNFQEQNLIAHKIEDLNSKIESSELNLKISIQKLQTYRQSLISEAVTGKIDIRDWSPNKQ